MSEQSIPNSSWATPSVGLATGTYTKVTSVIIYSLSQRNRVTGNLATHEAAFKSAQTHSSILGWWSIFGVFRTPEALARNTKRQKLLG